GVDGYRSGEPTAVGDRYRPSHPGDGAACRASGGPEAGGILCAFMFDGWASRLHDGIAVAFRLLAPAGAHTGTRSSAQAALDAVAPVALRPGGEILPAAAPGRRQASCGVRHA